MPAPVSPVLVYGANGFIGRNLCLGLAAAGRQTIAISRSFDAGFEQVMGPNVSCRQCDFSKTDELFGEAPDHGATHVLLISDSVPSTYSKNPSKEVSGNLLSYTRFFERMGEGDRVIFVSSGGTVYGVPSRHAPLCEQDVTETPISPYGLTKLVIEQYLELTARIRGFDYAILRPSNPVGPWSRPGRPQGIVTVALENHLAGKPVRIWGDGSTVRDYIDVRDLAAAIVEVIGLPQLGGEVYNVGSGVGRSLNEVLVLITETLGFELQIERDADRGIDVPYNVLDSTKLVDRTGWRPRLSFETTIRDTWQFLSDAERRADA